MHDKQPVRIHFGIKSLQLVPKYTSNCQVDKLQNIWVKMTQMSFDDEDRSTPYARRNKRCQDAWLKSSLHGICLRKPKHLQSLSHRQPYYWQKGFFLSTVICGQRKFKIVNEILQIFCGIWSVDNNKQNRKESVKFLISLSIQIRLIQVCGFSS